MTSSHVLWCSISDRVNGLQENYCPLVSLNLLKSTLTRSQIVNAHATRLRLGYMSGLNLAYRFLRNPLGRFRGWECNFLRFHLRCTRTWRTRARCLNGIRTSTIDWQFEFRCNGDRCRWTLGSPSLERKRFLGLERYLEKWQRRRSFCDRCWRQVNSDFGRHFLRTTNE